ncbi:MAG TPA: rRNA maturation RNase YbeY [Wenzhouxiangella sp.]|nr:rRNA maturation RNase YbeY [Wenzhouxiangella sp.]
MPKPTKTSPPEPATEGLVIEYGQGAKLPVKEDELRRFAAAALAGLKAPELTIRIVDAAEGQQLNRRWRGGDGPTNVLSFEPGLPAGVETPLLGDIVICAPVVEREAQEQGKTVRQHCAHMIIHGILHLRGFDHISAEQAHEMEAEETRLLKTLGFDNPYMIDDD